MLFHDLKRLDLAQLIHFSMMTAANQGMNPAGFRLARESHVGGGLVTGLVAGTG